MSLRSTKIPKITKCFENFLCKNLIKLIKDFTSIYFKKILFDEMKVIFFLFFVVETICFTNRFCHRKTFFLFYLFAYGFYATVAKFLIFLLTFNYLYFLLPNFPRNKTAIVIKFIFITTILGKAKLCDK